MKSAGWASCTSKPTMTRLRKVAAYSSGDARSAYNALEVAATLATEHPPQQAQTRRSLGTPEDIEDVRPRITDAIVTDALQKRVLMYDKAGEEHYNLISALHKSVRNSDADAALYWLARMLEAGEDRLYVARRVVRMAVEDIGLADPNALAVTLAAKDAFDFLGIPEGDLALAQAVVYLCAAPKSNAVYLAYGAVQADVERTAQDPVPLHLRNAPTGLMKAFGYGEGYQVCARSGGEGRGHAVPARQPEGPHVLPSDGRGRGEANQSAAGRDSNGKDKLTTETRRHRGQQAKNLERAPALPTGNLFVSVLSVSLW